MRVSSRSAPFSQTVISGLMVIADGIVVFLTGEIIYFLYVGWDPYTAAAYGVACGITAGLTVALLYRLEVYPVGGENDYIKKFGSTLLGCTFASLAVVALAFGLKIS
ncbi:MAG: hypothetical protein ACREXR_24210, partial [Gammaproteobacteria bacterium]